MAKRVSVTLPSSPWVAVSGSTDSRALVRTLHNAREQLLQGATPSGLRSVVERSWRRCESESFTKPPEFQLTPDVEERWLTSPLQHAQPILRELSGELDSAGRQVLIVTDADAVILWLAGDHASRSAAEASGARVGARWSEDAAGTNGMGTALAEGHAVQIFGPEHLVPVASRWVCSAAVVRDPETGEAIGTIDISGATSNAHANTLSLVKIAARSIESVLGARISAERAALVEREGHAVRAGHARALVAPNGMVVLSQTPSAPGARIQLPGKDGGIVILDGRPAFAEPVAGGFVLWPTGEEPVTGGSLRIRTLGCSAATLTIDGRDVALSRRHSEILVLLALRPQGLTDAEVAAELYGIDGRPVSARAEISRLRRDLGSVLTTSPYRLCRHMAADFQEVAALVRRGDVDAALRSYPGPLLSRSCVPSIVEQREALEYALRDALLAARDPDLLLRWLDHPSGRDDLHVCRVLLGMLDQDDPRRAIVTSRLRRLCASVPAL